MERIENPYMVLITKNDRKKLRAAGYDGKIPIVKLFARNSTWLLTGEEDGYFYGYADLGFSCVEWGSITNEEELPTLKVGPFYLERDCHFKHKDGTNYLKLDTLSGI